MHRSVLFTCFTSVSMENWRKLQWFWSCFPSRGPFLPAHHDWIAPRFLCQPCLCELTFYCTLYGTLKLNVKHKGFNSTPEIHCPNKGDNFLHIHPPFLQGFIPLSSTSSFPLGLALFSLGNISGFFSICRMADIQKIYYFSLFQRLTSFLEPQPTSLWRHPSRPMLRCIL